MPDLNKQQEYFLPYVERYREIVKKVGDSITDYQARCGEPYVITTKEHDFLTFQFYPSLQLTLEKFLPFDRARNIQETIYKARTVLSSLFGQEDYEKYKDGSLALQDVQKLMDAYTAAGKILEPMESTDSSGKAGDERANQKNEGSMLMITVRSNKEIWEAIENEYGISKRDFGKKINFVSDPFKREIIFRDVAHAFVLASHGFSKPALILAGGIIEELLRLYLEHKRISPKSKKFFDYIKTCEDSRLLKLGVSRLTDSVRDFRNLVHLDNEKTKRHTVSKATAKGAVSSIFTIANDFQ
jgi:hypothetical protein